ncbi:MAG TPA: hypothetical protein VK206_10275, partial [Anaerolineales bacterium]|nr:hypothetical protein [Anaerolineales bacterium]
MIISELSLLLEYIHHNGWWDIRYLNDVPGKNQMSQSHYSTSTLFLEKLLRLLIILSIGLTALVACRISSREYTTDDQYALARSRIDNMKEQLDFSFSLEKDSVHVSEKIFFVAHFTNATNKPVTLRVPQQSGLLDINHPNATLVYSISPMDKTISISTSLSGLGTVYI